VGEVKVEEPTPTPTEEKAPAEQVPAQEKPLSDSQQMAEDMKQKFAADLD